MGKVLPGIKLSPLPEPKYAEVKKQGEHFLLPLFIG
jgi:hypothetical protein